MNISIKRLSLSKGSASQGAKYLQDLNAVRRVDVVGEQSTPYEALAELRRLAGRFLRRHTSTHFEGSEARPDRAAPQLETQWAAAGTVHLENVEQRMKAMCNS